MCIIPPSDPRKTGGSPVVRSPWRDLESSVVRENWVYIMYSINKQNKTDEFLPIGPQADCSCALSFYGVPGGVTLVY